MIRSMAVSSKISIGQTLASFAINEQILYQWKSFPFSENSSGKFTSTIPSSLFESHIVIDSRFFHLSHVLVVHCTVMPRWACPHPHISCPSPPWSRQHWPSFHPPLQDLSWKIVGPGDMARLSQLHPFDDKTESSLYAHAASPGQAHSFDAPSNWPSRLRSPNNSITDMFFVIVQLSHPYVATWKVEYEMFFIHIYPYIVVWLQEKRAEIHIARPIPDRRISSSSQSKENKATSWLHQEKPGEILQNFFTASCKHRHSDARTIGCHFGICW